MQAQDRNNPWAFGLGVNAVDFYPTGQDAPLGGYFEDFFNTGEHWNVLPGISRISLARHVGGGFYFEAAGSVNMIERFGTRRMGRATYYGLDGMFNYSFRNDANDGWFDPILGVGGGYTWIDSRNMIAPQMDDNQMTQTTRTPQGAPTLNGTAGFNIWFSDNFALTLQTVYKHTFQNDAASHFQHVAGLKVAFGGVDTDGDGVYDRDDECPEVPGLPEFNGCPDTDGDGIEDRRDACPNEAGLAQFDGCPDTDGDGVPDPQDECPTVAGTAAMNGCPDTDGDGIADPKDECPNEAGPRENNGCPWQDRDGDGVNDNEDECPDDAGPATNNGCPEPGQRVMEELNRHSRTILFDLNRATIRRDISEPTLDTIAQIMQRFPNTTFRIEGHTDNTGDESYNQQLSERRAQAVKRYLVQKGVSEDDLVAEGFGESQPISENNTRQGRQANRRVEISVADENAQQDINQNMNNQSGTNNNRNDQNRGNNNQ